MNEVTVWAGFGAADFYQPPYDHYPEVLEMLRQQGFWNENGQIRED